MLPAFALALVFASSPEPTADSPKPPKPTPEQRLAELDRRRISLGMGVRGYGRFLDADPAGGAGLELDLGLRLVRGLYLQTSFDFGAHGLPPGLAARGFVGLRHELRLSKWVRPSLSLGYTHQLEAQFAGELGGQLPWELDEPCGCPKDELGWHAGAEAELASRGGVEAGLGLRFPFRSAPRLSAYLNADVAYYFDGRPGRLQAGASTGLQIVF